MLDVEQAARRAAAAVVASEEIKGRLGDLEAELASLERQASQARDVSPATR